MRSKQLDLTQYYSDKIVNSYMDVYDPVLEPWVNKEIQLLEIGILQGGSLLLWQDYFLKGKITGVDLKLPDGFPPQERIQMFTGSQDDTRFLTEVAIKSAPEGFDIIIDDASHVGSLTKTTFWHLFDNHLKPGGMYVIEDWGTGYWDEWLDGRRAGLKQSFLSKLAFAWDYRKEIHKKPFSSHNFGMVGFIKELVDEQGVADLTKSNWNVPTSTKSKFESILITPYIVFVKKNELVKEVYNGGGNEN